MYQSVGVDRQTLVYRQMRPWQRLQAACELYWFAREIIKNREKLKHNQLTPNELEQTVRSFFK